MIVFLYWTHACAKRITYCIRSGLPPSYASRLFTSIFILFRLPQHTSVFCHRTPSDELLLLAHYSAFQQVAECDGITDKNFSMSGSMTFSGFTISHSLVRLRPDRLADRPCQLVGTLRR